MIPDLTTVHFSQDIDITKFDNIKLGSEFLIIDFPHHATINSRVNVWENILLNEPCENLVTLSEHPLLIAQWYHAAGKRKFQFKQWWLNAADELRNHIIPLDTDGSLLDAVVGGFFGHRLKYLR